MLPHTSWVGLLNHVAHEYGHTWIGPALLDAQSEPPENFGWLLEGATESRADRVLLSAGLIDMPGYAQRFNPKLARYDGPYRSARSANLEAIVAGFWTGDYAIQRQPYLRGNLLAHDWNARILQSIIAKPISMGCCDNGSTKGEGSHSIRRNSTRSQGNT
ncbi:MAG: hypothetical protein OSB70_19165 [Myxococcota bacterium]|nr:hypothetical protein [Myxococcota bacterium]